MNNFTGTLKSLRRRSLTICEVLEGLNGNVEACFNGILASNMVTRYNQYLHLSSGTGMGHGFLSRRNKRKTHERK